MKIKTGLFTIAAALLGLITCACADGVGDAGGAHGLGSTIYGAKTVAGPFTVAPTTDLIPLKVYGSSSSATKPIVEVYPYLGSKNTIYVDQKGRSQFQSTSDGYVPVTIFGNSSSQSAPMLSVYTDSGEAGRTGSSSFAVGPNSAQFTNPTNGNKSVQLTGGPAVIFHTDGAAGGVIQGADAGKPITIQTSTTTGADDVTNIVFNTTGNELGVATQFDAAVTSTLSCATGFSRVDLKSCLLSNQEAASATLSSGVCKTVAAPDAGATAETIAGSMGVNTTGTATLIFYSDSTCTTSMAQDVAGQNSSAVMSFPFRRHLVLPSAGATISMKNTNGGGTYWVTQYND